MSNVGTSAPASNQFPGNRLLLALLSEMEEDKHQGKENGGDNKEGENDGAESRTKGKESSGEDEENGEEDEGSSSTEMTGLGRKVLHNQEIKPRKEFGRRKTRSEKRKEAEQAIKDKEDAAKRAADAHAKGHRIARVTSLDIEDANQQ